VTVTVDLEQLARDSRIAAHELARLHAEVAGCERCVRRGFIPEAHPIFKGEIGQRVMVVGQAPGGEGRADAPVMEDDLHLRAPDRPAPGGASCRRRRAPAPRRSSRRPAHQMKTRAADGGARPPPSVRSLTTRAPTDLMTMSTREPASPGGRRPGWCTSAVTPASSSTNEPTSWREKPFAPGTRGRSRVGRRVHQPGRSHARGPAAVHL